MGRNRQLTPASLARLVRIKNLRASGGTFAAIGKMLGISAQRAQQLVKYDQAPKPCQHLNWDEYFDKCSDCGKSRGEIEVSTHCPTCAAKLIDIRRGMICPQCLADKLEQINALSTL